MGWRLALCLARIQLAARTGAEAPESQLGTCRRLLSILETSILRDESPHSAPLSRWFSCARDSTLGIARRRCARCDRDSPSGRKNFRQTHAISRGTRPLHITAAPSGAVYWGEYFDNAARDEVHIYASSDQGQTWHVAYTFPKGAIRHVHNIVHDPWGDCLWILTGDYGDECRILRATCDLTRIDVVLQGNQQARTVAAVPTENEIYFSSDTPLESNYIYRLDRQGKLSQLAGISSSSIYGCRVGSRVFFSTMVEPSEVNRDPNVRIYGTDVSNDGPWKPLFVWQKDVWPMGLFQYGNAFLPDGTNTTRYLALSTIAVERDDQTMLLYACT